MPRAFRSPLFDLGMTILTIEPTSVPQLTPRPPRERDGKPFDAWTSAKHLQPRLHFDDLPTPPTPRPRRAGTPVEVREIVCRDGIRRLALVVVKEASR